MATVNVTNERAPRRRFGGRRTMWHPQPRLSLSRRSSMPIATTGFTASTTIQEAT
jgi:hypothetical protein